MKDNIKVYKLNETFCEGFEYAKYKILQAYNRQYYIHCYQLYKI
jgi:hypothetical protein